MKIEPVIARRELIKATATIAAVAPAIAAATSALGAEQPQQPQLPQLPSAEPAAQPTTLAEVLLGPNTKLTIERRGQVALFGLNRPKVQNRVDPETFQALAKAIYDYDHDASLRVAILFGHGDNFSRGIDVEAYRAVAKNRQSNHRASCRRSPRFSAHPRWRLECRPARMPRRFDRRATPRRLPSRHRHQQQLLDRRCARSHP
jgi:Enoyl-CoA hydratase/isomerase